VMSTYTMYIHCTYHEYTWIYNVYHVHMLHRAANVAEDDAVLLMLRRTTDLGLHCHRVTFNLAIKLYHDA
jgi:hypothetical protein